VSGLGYALVDARMTAANARREMHEQRARWGATPLGAMLMQAAERRRDDALSRAERLIAAMDASPDDVFPFDHDPAFSIVRVRS